MNLVKFVCVLVGRNAPPPISSKNSDFHLPVKLVRFPNCHEASGLGNLTTDPYPKFESRSFSSCMLSKTVIRHVNVKNVLDISSHTD